MTDTPLRRRSTAVIPRLSTDYCMARFYGLFPPTQTHPSTGHPLLSPCAPSAIIGLHLRRVVSVPPPRMAPQDPRQGPPPPPPRPIFIDRIDRILRTGWLI